MKTILSIWLAVAMLYVGVVNAAEVPKQRASKTSQNALDALEQKLLGEWTGPSCGGNYHFKADGTFQLTAFTPGGNTITGTWSLRWDNLPPTLVLLTKTSDFTKRDPTREEYIYLGKPLELKVLELTNDNLLFGVPKYNGIEQGTFKAFRPDKDSDR